MNETPDWQLEVETARLGVATAITAQSDALLQEQLTHLRQVIRASGVAPEEDLEWWPWEGHHVKATSDYRALPLYMLYKRLAHAFRVDLDSGIEPQPVWTILSSTLFDPGLGFFISIKLGRDSLSSPQTLLSEAAQGHLGFWQGNALGYDEGLSAIDCFLDSYRAVHPSTMVHWVATQGVLNLGVRGPFAPFFARELLSEKWVKVVAASLRPYVLMIAGVDPCELVCHMHDCGWILVARNTRMLSVQKESGSEV